MDRYFDPDRPRSYSYKGENNSLVDRYLLRHWWPVAIKAIPARMPSNLVSMIGNLGSYLAFAIAAGLPFGEPESAGRSRPWMFAIAALSLFFYQTFDALDGIQARRTGAAGPLGEFVDHWFDSFNAFLLPFGIMLAFPVVPWQLLPPCLAVYFSTNWIVIRSITSTGVLLFEKISSEEGQVLAQLFYLSIWLLGYDFWAKPSILGIPPIWALYAILPVGMALTGFRSLNLAKGLPLLMAAILSLLPYAFWIYLSVPRLGRTGLILGGLCLGLSGSRYVGQLMQERLIGRVYEWILPDIIIVGGVLCILFALPGMPEQAFLPLSIGALGWTALTLGLQFRTTLVRVKSLLGRGLFWPLTGKSLTGAGPGDSVPNPIRTTGVQ